jgi:small subunit ribosomal protein S6
MVSKTDESHASSELDEAVKYELMVILSPEMSETDTEKELAEIRKHIKDADGEIYHEDLWNIRNLAYRIKKQDKGFYAIFYFTYDPLKIKELEKGLFLNQKVLRHLVVKSPKAYVIKPLSELEFSEEDKKQSRLARETESRNKKYGAPRKTIKKVETVEKVEKAEKPEKVEPAKEKEVVKKETKKPTMDISDLDSKLDSILEDSDLKL